MFTWQIVLFDMMYN